LNFSGAGGAATRFTVTGPMTVVATPTRSCAATTAGIPIISVINTPSIRVIVVFIAAPRSMEAFERAEPMCSGGAKGPNSSPGGRLSGAGRCERAGAGGQPLISACHAARVGRMNRRRGSAVD
jgi:hypothetical protein